MGFLERLRQEKEAFRQEQEAKARAEAERLRQQQELRERLKGQEKERLCREIELHEARKKQAKEFSDESGIGTIINELKSILSPERPDIKPTKDHYQNKIDLDSIRHDVIWEYESYHEYYNNEELYKCIVAEVCSNGQIQIHHGGSGFYPNANVSIKERGSSRRREYEKETKGKIIEIPRYLWLRDKRLLESSLEKAYRDPTKFEYRWRTYVDRYDMSRPGAGPCLPGSTLINTPKGFVPIKELKIDDKVWTMSKYGDKRSTFLSKISKVTVKSTHKMLHIVLSDGRELFVSPGHPDACGNPLGKEIIGKELDGSIVISVDIIPYKEKYTYDILPSSTTGSYWASGILIGSTLAYYKNVAQTSL